METAHPFECASDAAPLARSPDTTRPAVWLAGCGGICGEELLRPVMALPRTPPRDVPICLQATL